MLSLNIEDIFVRSVNKLFLLIWYFHVIDAYRNTAKGSIVETQVFEFVRENNRALLSCFPVTLVHKKADRLFIHNPVNDAEHFVENRSPSVRFQLRQSIFDYITEHYPSCGCFHERATESDLNPGMEIYLSRIIGNPHFLRVCKHFTFTLSAFSLYS
ncbi:MAG: hypothetical protein A4E59_00634 [Syntrophorhabdus sp. PtaB.Bin027]|nr:MAG: hypothetical protein A4E59_00634 [Syntrophorhabdus sp. PtaB.Bin027]